MIIFYHRFVLLSCLQQVFSFHLVQKTYLNKYLTFGKKRLSNIPEPQRTPWNMIIFHQSRYTLNEKSSNKNNINELEIRNNYVSHERKASMSSNLNEETSKSNTDSEIEWNVYVCQTKSCKERGADATLGAFIGLAPPNLVSVQPAHLLKSKGKGPNIRCVQRKADGRAFEINNVDSVDKVYMILTETMGIKGIDEIASDCFKWNYKGNACLDKGEITQAIDCYNQAIATGYKDQQGVLYLMRATAYLQRAFRHRRQLKIVVSDFEKTVLPSPSSVYKLHELSYLFPAIAMPNYNKMLELCRAQDAKFQQVKFQHGLYENALLHATRDALHATEILPNYAKSWLRVGDSLAELRKYKESASYYEKALELDPSLDTLLVPMIEKLQESQAFLDQCRASGWSDDTLRISLDVAG